MNRLARESSPYLRQHAHNPIDWYPWGSEALGRARDEDRPIFLSIGYSACHWCHVMERESFDDPAVAGLLNEGFVNIKVDREERPDVDAIYMRAVQGLTGRGGWPLSVFLTPTGEPFYGGTYFPPEPRHGLPSFREVAEATLTAWRERPGEVREAGTRMAELLRRSTLPPGSRDKEEGGTVFSPGELAAEGAREILLRLDPVWGGFGRSPKFPQPVVLGFLLEHHLRTGDGPALEGVLLTLRRMAAGGVRDHLGGGFHRYAVDQRWRVPHFEKMLCDNALLASVYLAAFQLSGDPDLARICREILDDLLADFTSPEGAFHTARDADSEGEEGTYYLWTAGEIDTLLPAGDAELFRRAYGVTEEGNFEGRNILHLPEPPAGLARREGIPVEEVERVLRTGRERLARARTERTPPLRDEKVLTGWNALTIRALAEAGAALGEPGYLAAAVRGADHLLHALRPEGRLLHQLPAPGGRRIPAFLDDVAGLGNALLSLHEATLDPRWAEEAIALDEEVEARFRDLSTGILHDTPSDAEPLVMRPREPTDSPVPSGTSLAAELRLRLARLLGDPARLEAVERFVRAEEEALHSVPIGFGRLLAVTGRLADPPLEVAVVGAGEDDTTGALLREIHRPFLPGRVVSGIRAGEPPPFSSPLLEGRRMLGGKPTAYVCRDFSCRTPVTDPDALANALADPIRTASP